MNPIYQEQLLRARTELELCDKHHNSQYPLIYIDGQARQLLAVWPTLYKENTELSFFTAPQGPITWLQDDSGECEGYEEHRLQIFDEEDNILIHWIFRAITEFVTPTFHKIRDTKEYLELKGIEDVKNCSIINMNGHVLEEKYTVRDVIHYREFLIGHYWKRKTIRSYPYIRKIVIQRGDFNSDLLGQIWTVLGE
jgi:hypothetical protein